MRAAIFDMDGVLADSEPLICAAACAMFRERGLIVRPEDFHPFVGAGENRYIGGVAEKYGVALDIAQAKARTYELYLRMVPEKLSVFPGAAALVAALRAEGWPCAVASSADRIKVDANLRKIGLPAASWQAVVTAEDVERRKPDPAIFLKAAARLGVEPARCTVIEDAVNGIAAAKAAGMRCVAVATTFPAEKLTQADVVRASIAEVTLADLRE
ncbi:MAG TPA: HAD-IA family hydrolase [Kiritimatiellia bacterium]|nr:HAD-IA family hydrolase [Kiritimatiellia bacterium]HPS06704.1 HAD-IA family hydrolase [Kiritimatiellia bacterium]